MLLAVFGVFAFELVNQNSGEPGDPAAVRPGRQASPFNIKLFSDESFSLAEQRGKPVVVNFWASWCPPCREEAPALERAWKTYQTRGVAFVGIDVWDNETDARGFIKEFELTYPNGQDVTGEIAIEYGLTGVPETWFINKEGRMVRRWLGPMTDRQIASFIEEALK
jgi:cytochrome c biogenesis protein CcmG/thiol:disulfide interchange protein DsbE